MARTGKWRRLLRLAVVLVALGWAGAGQAEELAIQSFNGSGRLMFNTLNSATNYRVEWASSPAGPWTNTWAALAEIAAPTAGLVTCFVPMCYRVVATPYTYLVVDLAAGPSAASYPVTYLMEVPPGGWTDVYKTTKLVLRRIPTSTSAFMMGSPEDELGRQTDETQHAVTLSQGFYVGVFEITQKQWERVKGSWPSYFSNTTYRDARPVEQVTYNMIRGSSTGSGWPVNNSVDASSFLGLLRAKTGLAFDLPTESQWEFACRAGTGTALNSGYDLTSSTGNDARMNEVGRYWHNGGSGYTQDGDTSVATAMACSYLPNAWGLYDMHGNVWEWCLDWYGAYPGTVTDPKGATSGSNRVLRGGSWVNQGYRCRSAYRNYSAAPGNVSFNIGLRVALPPSQQ